MTGSASLQMGAIAAVYLLWLVSWLVLGHEAFGPARYNWDQTLVATIAAIAAFNASRQALKPYPVFLIMIGIGLAMLTASWFTYDPDDTRPFLRFPGQGAPDYSAISYALFVFVWVCAWGYLALNQWQRRPPSVLTGVVFAVLIFGLAVILANFYYPQYRSSLDTIAGRLDAVTSGLEFAALVIGLACILLGEPAVLTWMLFATALLVASDMAYSEADVPSAIEPVWMLGNFCCCPLCSFFPVRRRLSRLGRRHDPHWRRWLQGSGPGYRGFLSFFRSGVCSYRWPLDSSRCTRFGSRFSLSCLWWRWW